LSSSVGGQFKVIDVSSGHNNATRVNHDKEQRTCGERKEVEINVGKMVDKRDASIIEQGNTKRHNCAELVEQLHVNELSSWL